MRDSQRICGGICQPLSYQVLLFTVLPHLEIPKYRHLQWPFTLRCCCNLTILLCWTTCWMLYFCYVVPQMKSIPRIAVVSLFHEHMPWSRPVDVHGFQNTFSRQTNCLEHARWTFMDYSHAVDAKGCHRQEE